MKNILFEVSPIDPVTEDYVTIKMSTSGVSSPGAILEDDVWLPLIVSRPTMDMRYASSGQLSPIEMSYGQLTFNVSDQFDNVHWSTFIWNGAQGSLFWGEEGDDFEDYTQIWEGTVSSLERDDYTATVTLLGTEATINENLLYASYLGTGGPEGLASLKGKLKPWVSGHVFNIDPVLVDPAHWVFQVHGYGAVNDIPTVYEFAQALSAPTATVASYADLLALPLEPGQWAKAPLVGMFRLGGQPSQKLTCDVEGAWDGTLFQDDIAGIITHLIKVVAPAASVGDLSAFDGLRWGFYSTTQITVGDVVRQAAVDAGGYIFPDETGTWQVGKLSTPKAAIPLHSSRDTLPLVESVKELPSAGSIYKARVGFARCWSPHTDAEISPAISDLQGVVDFDPAEIEEAIAAAETAISRVDAMAADGILNRPEKKRAVADYNAETNDKNKYDTASAALSITTERTAYLAKYADLTTYLATLDPDWDDTSEDTPIVRTEWDAAWVNLLSAKTTLLHKMNSVAATTSSWTGVTGSGKPQDNATVGAPNGTPVGGKLAEDIVDALSDGTGLLIQSAAIQTTIDELTDESTGIIALANDALEDTEAFKNAAAAAAAAAALSQTGAATSASNSASAQAAAEAAKTASETARNNAQTYATNASNSATASAGSATTAGTSATNAGNSAAAAAASDVSARINTATGPIFPSDFSQDGKFWFGGVNSYTGDPATRTPITPNSIFSFATITGVGRVLQANTTTGNIDVAPIGARKLAANRTYKVTTLVRTTSASGTRTAQIIFIGLLADYSYQGTAAFGGAVTTLTNGVWTELTVTLTSATVNAWLALGTPAVFVRPLVRLGGFTATYEVASLLFEDITESTAAAGSASAAATSSSSAGTSATNAGASATAANSAKVAAESARDAASGSATAAATSASTASTQATNAGNSATAASNSEVAARVNAATGPILPSDFAQDGKFWSNNLYGAPATLPVLTPDIYHSFQTESGIGRVIELTGNGSGYIECASIGVVPIKAGRTYRLRVNAKKVSGTGILEFWALGIDAAYSFVGGTNSGPTLTTSYADYELTVSGTAALSAGMVYLRILMRSPPPGGTQVIRLRSAILEDITESTSAAGSASAAATSASTASTQATNSGNSATAANSAKVAAESARDAASGSASAASGSASTASTQATNAGNSATAAAASSVAATITAAATLPSDFSQDGRFWMAGYAGAPTGRVSLAADATHTFQTEAGVGRVLEITQTGSSVGAQAETATFGSVALAPNRIWRLRVRMKKVSGTGSTLYLAPVGLTSSYGYATWSPATATLTSSYADYDCVINSNTYIASGAAHIQGLITTQGHGQIVVRVQSVKLEDITESNSAAGSASAAATSASSASTSATNAGTSASAASTSATNANTSAGNASTYATNSSNSATAAAGSATTAGTHATNAGNSASAASGSASTATAQAAAASSSATLAASLGLDSINQNPTFSSWTGAANAPPNNYGWWAVESGGGIDRVAGPRGGYAARLTVAVNTNGGLAQGIGESTAMQAGRLPPGWYVLEAEVKLISGQMLGAGLYVGFHTSASAYVTEATINFATEPDSTGAAIGVGTAGRTYRFSKLVQITQTNASQGVIHPMSNWDGFGTRAAKVIEFNRASFRSATLEEIAKKTVLDPLVTSVATNASAIATANSNVATLTSTVQAAGITSSGNLLTNSDFSIDWSGWYGAGATSNTTFERDGAGVSWTPIGEHNLAIYAGGPTGGTGTYSDWWSNSVAAEPGKYYEASFNAACHRCQIQLYIGFFDAAGTALAYYDQLSTIGQWGGGQSLSGWGRMYRKAQAPSGTASVQMIFRKHVSPTGGEDSWGWFCRPQIKQVAADATGPQAYLPGSGGAALRQTAATVSSFSSALSTLNSGQATLMAKQGIRLDVNGYASGFVQNNNGWSSDFNVSADYFRILKPGGGARFEFYNGAIFVFDASGVLRVKLGNLDA